MNYSTLITALLFIAFEAIGEGLILRHSRAISEVIFDWWVQILIALLLFTAWLLIAVKMNVDYSVIKLVVGFVLLRFAVFDPILNISAGLNINYIGKTKLYDRVLNWIATKWGMGGIWFPRAIALFWGCAWLLDFDGWRATL